MRYRDPRVLAAWCLEEAAAARRTAATLAKVSLRTSYLDLAERYESAAELLALVPEGAVPEPPASPAPEAPAPNGASIEPVV